MRAIRLSGFGPPEVLVAEEVAAPSAGSGQALVEVAFANITFVETQFRATGFGPFQGEFPVIPGNGVGGVVPAGVGLDAAVALLADGGPRSCWSRRPTRGPRPGGDARRRVRRRGRRRRPGGVRPAG